MLKGIITSVLIFIVGVCWGQNPTDQYLSYFSANKSISKVLDELSDKSGTNIIYSKSKLPKKSNVTVSFTNESLGTILQVILDDYKLSFSVIEDQIVIVRKDEDRNFKLYGWIRDINSDEVLPYATVYFEDNERGVNANENGFFSLKTYAGENKIICSYVGYQPDTIVKLMRADSLVNIYLEPMAELNEISFLDSTENKRLSRSGVSKSKVGGEYLAHNLHLGGEADILRVLSNEPGISSAADGFGGFSVRGGNVDQNLVLLDGIPVYNTGHALGIISIFNSSVIKDATIIKGGFPARYGGRLSSVVDVRTREGNYNELAGEVNLSILSSKIVLEGPIATKKSSFLFSARRTYADPWIKGISRYQIENGGGEGESNYYFYDLNAKVNFELGAHRLFFNAYKGADDFEHNSIYKDQTDNDISGLDWNWGNTLFSAHLNSRWGKSSFSRLMIYSSEFDLNSFEKERYQSIQDSIVDDVFRGDIYNSKIETLGARLEFDHLFDNRHFLKYGVSYEKKNFKPFTGQINNNTLDLPDSVVVTRDLINVEESNIELSEINFFVEDEVDMEMAVVNFGINNNFVKAGEKNYYNIEPRASLIIPGNYVSFRMGIARMSQNIHLLSSYSLGLPKDLWVPSTANISPSNSWNFNLGLTLDVSNNIEFGIEGFYKLLSNIKNLPEGAPPTIGIDTDWDRQILNGEGEAYGVEFNINKDFGQSKWRFNYTYQKSTRYFDRLNQDREFIFGANRDHNIKFNFRRTLTKNAEFNLVYNFASGNYITVPVGDVIWVNDGTTNKIIEIYSGVNNEQLPHYHRLDLGFNFFSELKIGRQRLFLGVYNVFNKKNPLYIDLERDLDNPGRFDKIQYSILPIFPTFNYSLSF